MNKELYVNDREMWYFIPLQLKVKFDFRLVFIRFLDLRGNLGNAKKTHLFNLSSYRLTVEIRLFQSNLICNQLSTKRKSCPSHCIRKQQGEKYLLPLMIPILYLITCYIYLNTSKAKFTIDRPKAQIKMTLRLMKLLLSQLIQVKMLAMSYLLLTGSDYTSTFFGRTKCTF